MEVNIDRLIKNLENIKEKLETNDLLTDIDDFTIAILIGHLEELKESDE